MMVMNVTTATSAFGRWRSLLLRVLWVGTSSLLGVGTVGAIVVWAAFSIPWEVPDPPELSGPSVVTDADGNELAVPPGKVWVSLVPDDDGLSITE